MLGGGTPAPTTNAVRTITLSAPSVVSGQAGVGVIVLTQPAIKGEDSIRLSVDGPGKALLQLPDQITISPGKTAAPFRFLAAQGVESRQAVRLLARLGQAPPQAVELMIVPISVGTLEIGASELAGGHDAMVLVGLNHASSKPVTIQLTSSEPGVVIEPRAASLRSTEPTPLFRVTAPKIAKRRTITLTALANGQTFQKSISLVPSTKEGK